LKALKYTVVIFLLVLAIVAGVVHYYRESLVREAANTALGGLGITATELSIETLGTDIVRLSRLTLEQEDGARYEISDLAYPVSYSGSAAKLIAIGRLVLTPADSEAAPAPLAPLLRTLLQLPDGVPNTEVTVGQLAAAGFPPAHDVVWRTEGQRQQLALRFESINATVDIERVDDSHHRATVNATAIDRPDALTLQLDVRSNAGGVAMAGDVRVDTSPWVPVLKSAGLLPGDVIVLDAELAGPLTLELSDNPPQFANAGISLSLAEEFTAQYRVTDDLAVRLRGTASTPIAASLEYPSLEWTARVDQVDVRVGTDSLPDIPMRLSELECRAGIRCALRASVDTGPVELGTIAIANAKLAAPLTISTEDTTRVDVAQDAVMALTGLELPALAVAAVETTQLAGARLMVDDDGWHIDIERLGLRVDTATDRAGLLASGPVQLSELRVRDGGAAIDTEISMPPGAATVLWDGTGFVVPGVAGNLSLRDGRVAAKIELADDALSAHVETAHDIATGAGSVEVRDATLRFDAGGLSSRLVQWPYAWDVVAGGWTADLELSWHTGADGTEYVGTLTQRADNLAGQYNDTAFAGLSTALKLNLDAAAGVVAAPASLEIALLDVGLPLERIAADYALDIDKQAVRVENLSLATLGGRITADPFRFGLQAQRNDITLRPQSIQLPFIMNLVDFADIELTGSISGVIPVTIHDMQLTITDGKLESDAPGGVIRYRPGIELVKSGTSTSPLDLVSVALANFQFDSLTSGVDYNEAGDLLLKMKLSGVNPDMDDKQPVILNLSVDNNIPQLLRSLRATRSIEDILARKTAN